MGVYFTLFKRILLPKLVIQLARELVVMLFTSTELEMIVHLVNV